MSVLATVSISSCNNEGETKETPKTENPPAKMDTAKKTTPTDTAKKTTDTLKTPGKKGDPIVPNN
jgi:hypothetical protein